LFPLLLDCRPYGAAHRRAELLGLCGCPYKRQPCSPTTGHMEREKVLGRIFPYQLWISIIGPLPYRTQSLALAGRPLGPTWGGHCRRIHRSVACPSEAPCPFGRLAVHFGWTRKLGRPAFPPQGTGRPFSVTAESKEDQEPLYTSGAQSKTWSRSHGAVTADGYTVE
jgi:hypothetical protein